MRAASVVRLFRVAPAGAAAPDGRMALADHLRELRARILRVLLVLLVAFVVGLFNYERLLDFVVGPYNQARALLGEDVQSKIYIKDVAGPLLVPLKLAGVAAIVATSPYWLYQLWAFILPGLHPHERKWSRVFVAIAGPLFLVGVATGYYVLPRGLEVLIGFLPEGFENLVDFTAYFSFFARMLLVFGIAFEIPLFVVMLNLAGVVSGKALGEYRAWIIIGTFVFAAVATPSTDPFSMLALAIPMTLLFGISEVIARLLDKRRGREALAGLDDDEISELDYHRETVGRSGLGEDED